MVGQLHLQKSLKKQTSASPCARAIAALRAVYFVISFTAPGFWTRVNKHFIVQICVEIDVLYSVEFVCAPLLLLTFC